MALPEPAWRVKSRPCPFYQQGRCLFADSCNFIHSASIRVSSDSISIPRNTSVPQQPSTPSQIPIVTVNSPKSIRSPPRSPRLSGLLFALRDVIGDDPEDEEQFDSDDRTGEEGSQSVILDADNWSSGLPTLVNDTGFPLSFSPGHSPDPSPAEDTHMQHVHDNSYSPQSSPHASPRVLNEHSGSSSANNAAVAETEDDTLHSLSQSLSLSNNENNAQTTFPNTEESLPNAVQEVEAPIHISDPSSHLLSPVEISNLHLGPFLVDNHDYYSNSFDSGYADSFKPPTATITPRSPAPSSTFELLASPFGSPSHRILSPRVGALIGRSPISPLRQSFAPEQKAEPSAEYDLDSPTEYHARRRSEDAQETVRIRDGTLRLTPVLTPLTERLAADLIISDYNDSDEDYEEEEDSIASWLVGEPTTTAVFLGSNESSSAEDFLDDDQFADVEESTSDIAYASAEPENMSDDTEAFAGEDVVHAISTNDDDPSFVPEEAQAISSLAVHSPESVSDDTDVFVDELVHDTPAYSREELSSDDQPRVFVKEAVHDTPEDSPKELADDVGPEVIVENAVHGTPERSHEVLSGDIPLGVSVEEAVRDTPEGNHSVLSDDVPLGVSVEEAVNNSPVTELRLSVGEVAVKSTPVDSQYELPDDVQPGVFVAEAVHDTPVEEIPDAGLFFEEAVKRTPADGQNALPDDVQPRVFVAEAVHHTPVEELPDARVFFEEAVKDTPVDGRNELPDDVQPAVFVADAVRHTSVEELPNHVHPGVFVEDAVHITSADSRNELPNVVQRGVFVADAVHNTPIVNELPNAVQPGISVEEAVHVTPVNSHNELPNDVQRGVFAEEPFYSISSRSHEELFVNNPPVPFVSDSVIARTSVELAEIQDTSKAFADTDDLTWNAMSPDNAEDFLDDDEDVDPEEAEFGSYIVPDSSLDGDADEVCAEYVDEDVVHLDDTSAAFIPEESEPNPYLVAHEAEHTAEEHDALHIATGSREEYEVAQYLDEQEHRYIATGSHEEDEAVRTSAEGQNARYIPTDGCEDGEDSTAQLAYLCSPTAVYDDGDTLTSLYDVYTSPMHELRRPSPSPPRRTSFHSPFALEKKLSSSSSTPSSLLRERVFTPPPSGRSRSGTIAAGSPNSLVSPLTSLDSQSRGRASPVSVRSSSNSRVTEGTSKKVPFGFRPPSLALDKRASMVSNRTSRTVSQRQEDALIPEEPSPLLPSPSLSDNGSRLRPLRLSVLLDGANTKLTSRMSTTSSLNSRQSGNQARISMSSASVSSGTSLSNNNLLSSQRSSLIPVHLRNTQHSPFSSPLSSEFGQRILESADAPQSAPAHSQTWRSAPSRVSRASVLSSRDRRSSRYSEPSLTPYEELVEHDMHDETIRVPLGPPPSSAPVTRSRPTSVVRPPMYAIATPSPTLMFAIASDDVEQVRQVLERGNASPNDSVGPQSALEFAITNDQLSHKMDIVKTLLAFGADPTVAKKPVPQASTSVEEQPVAEEQKAMKTLIDDMDPATRYYVERADAAHTRKTSALIHRSFFRPLTRVRYELIGQDRALEQLFRVLSMHSRQLAISPIVVLLSGPSGHGKSLLARKFGSLLDVPTHTVNMTTLRSTHDLWQSYSMSPYETPTTCTLAEFLINNEGKRCVVVLDEIEKAESEQTLFSLLMPWELGRCCFDANSRHVDVRNVIWLGTSNIAYDLVFEHHEARENPNELMSREEYMELMGLIRPRVSEKLGASVLSRVTTVLPFVPFTQDERKAICSEALFNLGGEMVRDMSPKVVESVIDTALASYIPSEGARSLYRAISNQLVDLI